MNATSTLTSKGQVTVPRDVRQQLGLKTGDKLTFTMLPNGTVVLRAKTKKLADLVGSMVPPVPVRVAVDDMSL